MAKVDLKSIAANMKKVYADAQDRYAAMSGDMLPEGVYIGKQTACKWFENKTKGTASLICEFIATEGPNKGEKATDFKSVTSDTGLSYTMEYIDDMGYAIPGDDADEWDAIVEDIAKNKPSVKFEVETDGEFTNVKVLERLDLQNNSTTKTETTETEEPETEEPEEPETEEPETIDFDSMDRKSLKKYIKENDVQIKVTTKMKNAEIIAALKELFEDAEEPEEPVEDDAPDFSGMTRKDLKKYIKENDLKIKVTTKMKDADIIKAIEEAIGVEEVAEDDENIKEGLLEFFASEIPDEDVNDTMTIAKLKELAGGYDLKEADMEEDSVLALEAAGLGEDIIRD